MTAFVAGIASGLGVVLWWLFLSRVPWAERLGAIVLMVAGVFAASRLVHESVSNGMQGAMPIIYAIPALSLALVVWAVASRRLSAGPRRARSGGGDPAGVRRTDTHPDRRHHRGFQVGSADGAGRQRLKSGSLPKPKRSRGCRCRPRPQRRRSRRRHQRPAMSRRTRRTAPLSPPSKHPPPPETRNRRQPPLRRVLRGPASAVPSAMARSAACESRRTGLARHRSRCGAARSGLGGRRSRCRGIGSTRKSSAVTRRSFPPTS